MTCLKNGFSKQSTSSSLIGVDRKHFKRKRDNLDNSSDTMFCASLCVISGMSEMRAKSIQNVFKTPKDLIDASADQISKIKCNGRVLGDSLAKRIKMLYY